ncbi:Ubiquinol oxidase [Nymphaea thermarum]|nr:Ubiquinol oxidase [Nymphaea thermarum]
MNSRITTSLVLQILRHSRSSALCFSTAFSSQAIVRRSGTIGRRSILGVDAWERSFGSAAPELAKADADAAEKERSIAETVNREVRSRPDTGAVVSSYWGIRPSEITREDGTVWPWNCFRPSDTYTADLSIDLAKHHVPKTFLDKVAYRTVKLLRFPTDIFFQNRSLAKQDLSLPSD